MKHLLKIVVPIIYSPNPPQKHFFFLNKRKRNGIFFSKPE